MLVSARRLVWISTISSLVVASSVTLKAANPTAEQALTLVPVQGDKDVDYDKPTADQIAKCTIKVEQIGKQTGYVVRDGAGQILRRFLDTNGDNAVDVWSYFQDGLEVYRDIDTNHDSKAEEFRWMNTAGTRWGIDTNKDGKIDVWKKISAEEATAEVVRALANRDQTRFDRLLITADEVKSLGLGTEKSEELLAKVTAASSGFKSMASAASKDGPVTNWVDFGSKEGWIDFGATRPGVVPEGTDGSTKDIVVYENVLAMVDQEGKPAQLLVGTLIQVGDVWRVVDVPKVLNDEQQELLAGSGFFFKATPTIRPDQAGGNGTDEKIQKILADIEALDKEAAQATPDKRAEIERKKFDLLEKMADEAKSDEDREPWVRQLADSISVAVQAGSYPDGVARLKALAEKLAAAGDEELAAYCEFRYLSAEYGLSLQSPNPDIEKIQKAWLENLEKFVNKHPKSQDSAEALLQLGMAQEFAGQEELAKKWYGQLVKDFPDSPSGKKAAGAITRLDCVGKSIPLKAKSLTNNNAVVDLAGPAYRGKIVLIHYWATWCEPCKADMAQLKELFARYGKQGFNLIGVCVDNSQEELAAFLKQKQLAWPQLYEPGGLDSRLANELGILTLPTMILVDQNGRVINRNIHVTELEKELGARLK